MNYPMQQNYGAGLGALGPVQSMSDRNDAQMMMANGGQMFANGGITALAKGGLPKYKFNPATGTTELVEDTATSTTKTDDLLPKYKYNPATQTYELDESKKEDVAAGIEKLVSQRDSSFEPATVTNPFNSMTPAQQAAYYAANPTMAAITQGLQKGFGMTGLGQLAAFFSPDETGKAQAVAKGFDPSQTSFGRGAGSLFGLFGGPREAVPVSLEAYGYGMPGQSYGMMGPNSVSGVGVNSREGINAMDALSDSYTGGGGAPTGGNDTGRSAPGGGEAPSASGMGAASDGGGRDGDGTPYAHGGIASLAQGGPSHLGDYSDGGRLLRGPGDGVSDSIPASIGGKQPARLADGEFVVSADVVSGLGNGSTEAGAKKLYAMMDRVRKARTGNAKMGKTINADKLIPR
jgi:hypothetical protein